MSLQILAVVLALVLALVLEGAGYAPNCAYFNQANCTRLNAPPCDSSTKTCYVHPNVCDALAEFTNAKQTIATGWRVVLSTYSFQCTRTNFANCANPAAISATPLLSSPPSFCTEIGTKMLWSDVSFSVLGSRTPVRIFVPDATPATAVCSAFEFLGSGISLSNIALDLSRCFASGGGPLYDYEMPVTGLFVNDDGLTLNSVQFINTTVAVGGKGSSCDGVVFNGVSLVSPVTPAGTTSQPVLAAFDPCTGSVTSVGSLTGYTVVTTSGNTQVSASTLTEFPVATYVASQVLGNPPAASCVATPCPTCPVSDTGYTILFWVCIAQSCILGSLAVFAAVYVCAQRSARRATLAPLARSE
jgi:hypothetical protein